MRGFAHARPRTAGPRKGGRVVECAGLEIRCTGLQYRGFESLPFRHLVWAHSRSGPFFWKGPRGAGFRPGRLSQWYARRFLRPGFGPLSQFARSPVRGALLGPIASADCGHEARATCDPRGPLRICSGRTHRRGLILSPSLWSCAHAGAPAPPTVSRATVEPGSTGSTSTTSYFPGR